MELEKIKTIVYTSCVAVFTIVASGCLIMFARSSSKLMDRCGTKFEQIEDNVLKMSENGVISSENLANTLGESAKYVKGLNSNEKPAQGSKSEAVSTILDELAKYFKGLNSNEKPAQGSKSEAVSTILYNIAKITGDAASDEPSKPGSKNDNIEKLLKNLAELSQVTKEKFVGDENKKGALENASEFCERANNGVKNLNGVLFDTRTDKEKKNDEESRGGIIESDNVAFHAGADLKGEYNENSSLLDRFVSWAFCHPV
ncbi:MAG: hypothetical protein IJI84_01115 [Clostridia bacterium]|nr:hypothetical protein [Clostridia bacterium]